MSMSAHMSDSDAFSWYMERDPLLRSTVVAVIALDRAPDWELFRSRVERATPSRRTTASWVSA